MQDLPFGSEFSPSQINLPDLLELAKELGGDWRAFEAAILAKYFDSNSTSDKNKAKLANNTKLAMVAYGLIDRDAALTNLGERLYSIRSQAQMLYTEFARHILSDRYGITLVQCIQDMQASGEIVDLVKLRVWLEERGIHLSRGNKNTSTMHLWLAKAGIFTRGWNIDEARLQQVIGMASSDIEVLSVFSPEQRAYLKTLANISESGPYLSNEIEKLATTAYGARFNEKNLPKTVLYPLRDAGYIELTRGTREVGRGARPFLISPTAKLEKDLVLPILEQLEKQVGRDIRTLLRKPIIEILHELEAEDRHKRGLALEALAFKLMRLIDLTYVATRLRGTATGGADVSMIFESAGLASSRWQVRCKNKAYVTLDDIAIEVGLTHVSKSDAIVIISTGAIEPAARSFAASLMKCSNIRVVILDGNDLLSIAQDSASLNKIIRRESVHNMEEKGFAYAEVAI